MTDSNHYLNGFIPAQESTLFILIFRMYTLILYKLRFKAVWISGSYRPDSKNSTLYLLNHNSWWDGLTPFLLNEYHFRQKARAIMEDIQMIRYKFFKKIGAFSINRMNPRQAITSLDYASDWLNNPGTSVYIYPEGTLVDVTTPVKIEPGILRIIENSPGCHVIPIGLHVHTLNGSKPELFIKIGTQIQFSDNKVKAFNIQYLNEQLDSVKSAVITDSGEKDHKYSRLV